MATTPADRIPSALLPEWHQLLQGWAADGSLVAAAQEALMLQGEPPALRELVRRWAAGDFTGIPPIVLLSSADMNGAMGAYAISTETIYLADREPALRESHERRRRNQSDPRAANNGRRKV